MILNRHNFDDCHYAVHYTNLNPLVTNGIPDFLEPVEVMYLDLEKLIHECNFNIFENWIIESLMLGYTIEDCIDIFGRYYQFDVENMFKHICKRIKDQNDYNRVMCHEISGKIKIPSEVKYKRCSKCGKDLRTDNFKLNDNGKDGFYSYCKKCESLAKK